MIYSNYRVSLDIHDTTSQVRFNIKQGDSARKIYFSLTDGGKPYQISADCSARLRAKTSTGKILFNDCFIRGNVIEYTLTNATSKDIGIVECELTLYGGDGSEITSPRFDMMVSGKVVTDNEIESSNEFTALGNALREVESLNIEVQKFDDGAEIIVTKKDGSDQLVYITNGADGKDGYTPQKGIDYFDGADGKDADVSKLASAIVGTAKGTTISISDSANVKLRNLKIYGKSMQDGTPTPDAPIDIISVGDDGKLECDVCGKNLIEPLMENSTRNGITVTNNGDGSFTVNGTATSTASFRLNQSTANGMDNLKSYKGKYYLSLRDANGNKNPQGLMLFLVQSSDWENYLGSATKPTADIDVSGSFVYLHVSVGESFSNFVIYPQLEVGSSMTNWEEPIMSPLEITLNTPLRAIPVTDPSYATYTDVNGQTWYADEIDLNRGVYIQRCYAETVSMSFQEDYNRYIGAISKNANGKIGTYNGVSLICDELPFNGDAGLLGSQINGVRISTSDTKLVVAFYNGEVIDTLNVLYPLATPIETPLTAEEIAAYKLLKTNYPNTIITNNENAYMSAEYVIDTKTYIDNLVAKALGVASAELAEVIALQESYIGGGA